MIVRQMIIKRFLAYVENIDVLVIISDIGKN